MRAVSDLRSILSGERGSLSAAAHARGVDSLSPRAPWPGPSELGAGAWMDDHVLDCSTALLNDADSRPTKAKPYW